MLDEIVPSRPFLTARRNELSHGVELVITRKDHRFLRHPAMAAPAIVHLLLLLLNKHKVAENIEETVELEHFLPKISRTIARFVLGVARPTDDLPWMATAIERQEECFLA